MRKVLVFEKTSSGVLTRRAAKSTLSRSRVLGVQRIHIKSTRLKVLTRRIRFRSTEFKAFSRPEGPNEGYSLAPRNVPIKIKGAHSRGSNAPCQDQGYSPGLTRAAKSVLYQYQEYSFTRANVPCQDQGYSLARPKVPYRDQGYSRPKGPSSVPMSLSTAPVAMYLTPGWRVPLWNLPQTQTPPTPTKAPTATTATTDIPTPTIPLPPLGGGSLPSLPWGAP